MGCNKQGAKKQGHCYSVVGFVQKQAYFYMYFSIHSQACETGLTDMEKCDSPIVGESNQKRRRTISTTTFYRNEIDSQNFAGKFLFS